MLSKFRCFGQKKFKYNPTYSCPNGYLASFIKLCCHSSRALEFYNTFPNRNQIKSFTNFFIIGDQHTVESGKNLVESGEIDEAEKAKASIFNIISVFAPKA